MIKRNKKSYLDKLVPILSELMTCMFYCDVNVVSVWARSNFVLNKYQVFSNPRQLRKNLKRRLFRDDTDNIVPTLG